MAVLAAIGSAALFWGKGRGWVTHGALNTAAAVSGIVSAVANTAALSIEVTPRP